MDGDLARFLDQTLLDLCAVSSPIGEEKALCDQLFARAFRWAEAWGAPPPRRTMNSFVVPLYDPARSGGRPKIALVGHLDTVRTENGPARIEGDRLFGSGAADMKSGLAIMIALAEHAEKLRESVDLTLIFYSREEGPFAENELGPLLVAEPWLAAIDLAVCLEPSDNRLHLGCCGSLHAMVTFHGRTGHSARPWEGDNAVVKAAPLLAALAAQAPEETLLDGHIYRTCSTVTQAKDGGRGRNVVPDTFSLNINHRFAPSYSVDEAVENLTKFLTKHAPDAEIVFTDRSPGALPSASHPLVQALIRAGVTDVAPKQAWTDVARFSLLGVAAVNFGPGENAQAHQRHESTSLPLMHAGYMIFDRWLSALAEKG